MGRFSLSVGVVWIKYKQVGLQRPGQEMRVPRSQRLASCPRKSLHILSGTVLFRGQDTRLLML